MGNVLWDDLVILAETLEGLVTKMAVRKNCLESKGLKVNMGKTKVMILGRNLHTLPNILVQYAGGVEVLEGVLIMHRQLMEDLVLKLTCWWKAWCSW